MHNTGWLRHTAFVAAAIALSPACAEATVTGGSVVAGSGPTKAAFVKLSVPLKNPYGPRNSVGENTFESPNLYAFDEDQNINLKAPLVTDVGTNPIPAGKVVASHYVFFDPGPATEVFGVVEFDSRVIAIITATGTLAASDFLANTGVHYLNPSARGLEPEDYVAISGPNQITFSTRASNPGDYVRVLTEFSPKAIRITSNQPEPVSPLDLLRIGIARGFATGLVDFEFEETVHRIELSFLGFTGDAGNADSPKSEGDDGFLSRIRRLSHISSRDSNCGTLREQENSDPELLTG